MTNISFGSNYRFGIGSDYPGAVMNKLACYQRDGAVIATEFLPLHESMQTGIYENVLISAPDKFDGEIETLLLSNGIDFHKQTKEEALDLENIKNRIQLSDLDKIRDAYLIELDVKKLNELFKQDDISYIEPNGTNGIGSRYKDVGEYLKTGQNIDAVRVILNERSGNLAACIADGRHRFAYLRDMGMKTMPVCLDKDSFKLAAKHGLV